MAKRIVGVGVDCQKDFTVPRGKIPNQETGALYVPGAFEDMNRAGTLLKKTRSILDDLFMTIDWHHILHIAHRSLWRDRYGNMPDPQPPFDLVIKREDILRGDWVFQLHGKVPGLVNPATGQDFDSGRDYVLYYTGELEKQVDRPTRNCLRLWTEHCIIGTDGSTLHPAIAHECNEWARHNIATVNFLFKGTNWKTENYSAVRADVPDPTDSTTQFRTQFAETLGQADEVWWFGEALDFCVANTMGDIYDFLGPDAVKKCVLITDCTSPIFPALGDAFVSKMKGLGMRTALSTDF